MSKPMNSAQFVSIWFIGWVIVCVMSAIWLPKSILANTIPVTNTEGAKLALGFLKDWTVWMASIQTATIAALGFLAKDGLSTLNMGTAITRLGLLVALFNTLALFFSAWILTSLPSIALRTFSCKDCNVDFYNLTLYAFMEKHEPLRGLTVAFFAAWNHWLWAIGFVFAGVLSMAVFVKRGDGSRSK